MKRFITIALFCLLNVTCFISISSGAAVDPMYVDEMQRSELKNQVKELLVDEDFISLEHMAQDFRDNKVLFPSGSWKLDYYYRGLSKALGDVNHESYKSYMQILKRWGKAYPKSVTQRIVLANLYSDYGWFHRGSGYSETVTDDGAKKLKKYLSLSQKVLKKVSKSEIKDPYVYTTWVLVGMGLSLSKEELYDIVEQGNKVEPTFYATYLWMAEAMLPRWGAAFNDIYEYVDWLDDRIPSEQKDEIYTRVMIKVFAVVGGRVYKDVYEFPWERTKNGFLQLRKKYPQGFWILNQFALFSCILKDDDVGYGLINEIGDLWNQDSVDVWRSASYFLKWQLYYESYK